jgi:cellulose synthase/poly-beta-1,6-N-acetylglucosamine synthase-like glycosyltransferase
LFSFVIPSSFVIHSGFMKRISLVIPNYNGAATLERTLRSVLDQNYPNLQLIVADSASTRRRTMVRPTA